MHALQLPFVPKLAEHYAMKGGYVPVKVEASDIVLEGDTRPALAALGLRGEVVPTPGHSDDSVSLVLESGEAFVGDLPPPHIAGEAMGDTVRASWQALLARGARTIYPAHTGPVAMESMRPFLRAE